MGQPTVDISSEISKFSHMMLTRDNFHSYLAGFPVYCDWHDTNRYIILEYLSLPDEVVRVIDTVCGGPCAYNVRFINKDDLNRVESILGAVDG